MTPELEAVLWPVERLGDALTALAVRSGLSRRPAANPTRVALSDDLHDLDRWLEAAGAHIGVAIESVMTAHSDAGDLVAHGAPALLHHPRGIMAVVGTKRGHVVLLGPDGHTRRVPAHAVRAAAVESSESRLRGRVEALFARMDLDLDARRRKRAQDAVVAEIMAPRPGARGWLLLMPPGAPFLAQLGQAGLLRALALLLGAHVAQYLAFVLSWWTIGVGVLQGRFSLGWLAAWALLLVTMVPLRMLVTWTQGRLSMGVGALLKRRLLHGAMRLDADVVRHEGVGGLLGRAVEAEHVEQLALGGGILSALALVELVVAAVVLASGAGGLVHVGALAAWLALAAALGVRLARARNAWTDQRLELTGATVERMVGHRTRLAQEHPDRWHVGEDEALWGYLDRSVAMDRENAAVLVGIPRGWLLFGMLVVTPAFVAGATAGSLAASIGGVLLAWLSFTRLAEGIHQLVGAYIAWRRVAPLFHAAAAPEQAASPDHALAPPVADHQPVLEASALGFRYPGHGEPVFRDCDLVIRPGDRILLQGPSGGGKSTFASVLLSQLQPASGILLARGLDRPSLGDAGWRRRVTAAPQFHENYVLTETFAFNLLMGRAWPPAPEDMDEALAVCEELGLGPLLERMPGAMLQMVGDTGWQLSHGERSRLFIARALLQNSDVVILDESFAALDPENLARAMRCVRARARSLVVIAHP